MIKLSLFSGPFSRLFRVLVTPNRSNHYKFPQQVALFTLHAQLRHEQSGAGQLSAAVYSTVYTSSLQLLLPDSNLIFRFCLASFPGLPCFFLFFSFR